MADNHQTLVKSEAQDARRNLLAKYLKGEIRQLEAPSPIPRRPAGALPPLSFAQQQIWLHAQLAPGVPIYNEPMTIRRTGPLDVVALKRSLAEIVRRHEIWRTTFDVIDEQPVQIVHSAPDEFNLPVVDLRRFPETDRNAKALRIATEELRRPFDLRRGPPLRATLVRMADEDSRLFMVLHHLIHDGVAVYRVFLPELAALYSAYETGSPCHLRTPRLQYADYAVWDRKRAQERDLSNHMKYWREQLAGPLPVLQWPNDRPRPAQTFRGAMQPLAMSAGLIESLRATSRNQGVTLFMTLITGFLVVLHRYTGQEDVLLGTITSGRKTAQVDGLLGYFLNPLPLRFDLSGNLSFRDLLIRVRNVVASALSHDDVPFESLVKELAKERDRSRSPLFQIMLSLEPSEPAQSSGWDLTQTDIASGASKLDLFLDLDDRPEGIVGPITYNPDLFEDETIMRLVRHWQTVLEAAVANPDQKISELPLLTQEERRQLLVEWNATERRYPERCIHHLFEEQVAKTPEAVALRFAGGQLTYKDLNQRANQLAHYLCKIGIGPESLVGVYLERSFDTVVALLGVLKAGGAFVPIDPAYPQARVSFMLRDAKVAVVLTHARLAEQLPWDGVRVVRLDSDWPANASESPENPGDALTPDNLAYVIYTSGSTGNPKGVMGPHRGAVNRFSWMWERFPFEADEVCCQKTSLSFVDSIWEIFGPLLRGITTVIIPDDLLKNPPALIKYLAARKVTRLVLVPSLLRTIVETCPDLQQRLPRLKYWVCSGEALSLELAQKFAASMPRATLLNLYGSSEVAADSTFYRVEENDALACVPIGRPIANTQIYILDRNLQPVPVRTAGELYVGGDGLARGYLDRADLTADKFIPDPFSKNPNARLYKTGDLARYLPDGNVEYLGRTDSQVKIRGFRIELREVESVLSECPGVKQGVVVAREDAAGTNRLVAYLVASEGQSPKNKELQARMRQRLPEYMVPSVFVMLDSLPHLPNGKVDRRALPTMEQTDHAAGAQIVAPRNDLERQLLGIWEEVLGVRKIGIRNDFFELGGHSLLIPVLLSRMERIFGKKLSPAAIFQAPTVEHLAQLLDGQSAQLVQVMPIQPAGSKPPFFCICLAAGPLLRELALELGEDQPFLGLGFDPSALDQLATPYTLEDIAAHLVRAIRERQPEGPYFLGGFCLNGLIAFETARQLTAQGERVALLALFEAVNPAHSDSFSQRAQLATLVGRFRLDLLKNHVTSLFGLGASGAKNYLRSRFTDINRDTKNLFWSTYVDLRRRLLGERLPHLQQILYVAARSYHPVPYPGPTAFYRCTDRRANSSSELERGWSGLLSGAFELHVLKGDHLGILVGKSLNVLASKLTTSLAKARGAEELEAKAPVPAAADTAVLCADSFCGIRS